MQQSFKESISIDESMNTSSLSDFVCRHNIDVILIQRRQTERMHAENWREPVATQSVLENTSDFDFDLYKCRFLIKLIVIWKRAGIYNSIKNKRFILARTFYRKNKEFRFDCFEVCFIAATTCLGGARTHTHTYIPGGQKKMWPGKIALKQSKIQIFTWKLVYV